MTRVKTIDEILLMSPSKLHRCVHVNTHNTFKQHSRVFTLGRPSFQTVIK